MVKEDQEAAAEVGKVPFFYSPIFFGIVSGSIYFRCIESNDAVGRSCARRTRVEAEQTRFNYHDYYLNYIIDDKYIEQWVVVDHMLTRLKSRFNL